MKKLIKILTVLLSFAFVATMASCNNCEHKNKIERSNSATCEEKGVIIYFCNDCNKEFEIESLAVGHEYSIFVSDSATCKESGYITNKCSRCEKTNQIVSAQKKHNYSGAKCTLCSGINPAFEAKEIYYDNSKEYRYRCSFERLVDWTMYTLNCYFEVQEDNMTAEFGVSGNLKKFSFDNFYVSIYDSNNIKLGSGGIMLVPSSPSYLVSREITLSRVIKSGEICFISITTTA